MPVRTKSTCPYNACECVHLLIHPAWLCSYWGFWLLTDVVTDAMGIYTTYIALNALTPIGLPDEMRQKVESKWTSAVLPLAYLWSETFKKCAASVHNYITYVVILLESADAWADVIQASAIFFLAARLTVRWRPSRAQRVRLWKLSWTTDG